MIDERGATRITIVVGAQGNGGGFAFEPASLRVDPGTTIIWEWTGEGGSHNVSATDGTFESEMLSSQGETFENTFEDESVTTYVCVPHEAMGMKGAVRVGDVEINVSMTEPAAPERTDVDSEQDYIGWFNGVTNFKGTVDARGERDVLIAVGPLVMEGNSHLTLPRSTSTQGPGSSGSGPAMTVLTNLPRRTVAIPVRCSLLGDTDSYSMESVSVRTAANRISRGA